MAARHLEIAREDGPKAGFKAWKEQMSRSGLPQVKARLREVEAQGNTKAQFDYYCAQYGKQIFGTGTRNATPAPEAAGQLTTEELTAKFAEFLASQGIGEAPEAVEGDSLDEIDEDAAVEAYTRSSGTTRKSRKSTTPAEPARDAYAPRDPNAAATAGRLWKLNEAGLLQIRKNPGTVIDNGTAHEILKSILG
jgi:hypothetical protein